MCFWLVIWLMQIFPRLKKCMSQGLGVQRVSGFTQKLIDAKFVYVKLMQIPPIMHTVLYKLGTEC